MKTQYKIGLVSIGIAIFSIIVRFDVVELVLAIIFAFFAIASIFASKSQTINVFWLFSGLILIAYGIYYAYETIPGGILDPIKVIVSVGKVLAGLIGVIATVLALELKYE